MAPQLAWIGLGNMGRKGNLSSPLIIFNRTAARAHDLSSSLGHSTVASSIEDAVSQSDIIFICLGDDSAVQETITKATQIQSIKGKLFVDCSTIHPSTTSAISNDISTHGAHFVACPVFGAPPMADSGQLVCVLAGPAEQVERIKPYCTGVMGRTVIDFSDQPPSKASTLKILGNTFILSMITALAEGHVVAEKTGLGVDALHQFIEAIFPGPYVAYSNRMRSGDYFERESPLFEARLARKDARHAMDLAGKEGVRMRGVAVADGLLEGVMENMGGRGDIAGIYGAKRVEAGLDFENK